MGITHVHDGLLSHSVRTEEVNENLYEPDVFQRLPLASPDGGIHLCSKSELGGVRRMQIPAAWVEKNCKPPITSNEPRRVRKSPQELRLPRWNPNVDVTDSDFAYDANGDRGERTRRFLEIIYRSGSQPKE